MMLLEIKDLWVHYGKAEAIKGVSINVEEGTIVTLLGANGAGKTTTLRTISGLKRPTSGEIWYGGRGSTCCRRMKLLNAELLMFLKDGSFFTVSPSNRTLKWEVI
jgi:ABC-type branched-subunit amino acid transport system ATPase component